MSDTAPQKTPFPEKELWHETRGRIKEEPYEQPGGWTITRETLLTPAHSAVIEAVKQFLSIYNNETVSDPNAAAWAIGEMEAAVATLRKQEGET